MMGCGGAHTQNVSWGCKRGTRNRSRVSAARGRVSMLPPVNQTRVNDMTRAIGAAPTEGSVKPRLYRVRKEDKEKKNNIKNYSAGARVGRCAGQRRKYRILYRESSTLPRSEACPGGRRGAGSTAAARWPDRMPTGFGLPWLHHISIACICFALLAQLR